MVLASTPPRLIFHFIPHPTMTNAETNPHPANKSIPPHDASHASQNGSANLSDRELQVIELVAGGLTNQDIAEALAISKRTVDNHISNILTKTQTDNRVALVRWALQWGKVCIDEVNCCIIPPAPRPSVKIADSVHNAMTVEGSESKSEMKNSEHSSSATPLTYNVPEEKMQRVS